MDVVHHGFSVDHTITDVLAVETKTTINKQQIQYCMVVGLQINIESNC